MSNKTRLEAVSSSLDTAINTANSLPDAGGGSGSGANIETCTMTIVSDGVGGGFMDDVFCTEFGTKLTTYARLYVKNSSTSIKNVVKGSVIYLDAPNIMSINGEGIQVRKLSTSEGHCVISINNDAPDEITITLSSNN